MTMIDLFVLVALRRLTGVRAFIEHADQSIPVMEDRARKALKELATQEDWDYSQYDVGEQVLDADYRHSIPRYTTYSAIILLASFLETQLVRCAEKVGQEKNTLFQVRDLKGGLLEAASFFLQRVSDLRIQDDPDWQYLKDMRALRNIIVHRHGRRGDLAKHQEEFDRLLEVYKPELSVDPNGLEDELIVSIQFCREYGQKSEIFVKRLFISLGSQHSGLQK